jgi:LacI family transcriptional regulator
MKNNRTTIHDVARLAGVSISSVSVVVNNKDKYISPQLRKKVEDAINTLNYQPNLVARSLKIQQTKSIGLIVTNITSPIIPPLVRTVQKFAQQKGYDTFIVSSEEDAKIQNAAIRSMLSKRVDGLIICPTLSDDNEWVLNAILSVPVVSVERQLPKTSSVFTNNKETAYQIASHLIGHGYQKIGMITMQVFGSNTRERIDGYQRALIEHQMLHPDLIRETDFVGLSAYDAAIDLIKTQKIDAIMAASQSITLGTYKAVMDMGLRIPDDISIFGYDDLPWMEVIRPSISTTHQPIQEIATKACDILFGELESGDKSIESHCIDTDLVIRESCGCDHSR